MRKTNKMIKKNLIKFYKKVEEQSQKCLKNFHKFLGNLKKNLIK